MEFSCRSLLLLKVIVSFFKTDFVKTIMSCALKVELYTILIVFLYLQYCFPSVSAPNTVLTVSEC